FASLDVKDRRFLRVLDSEGKPLPGAEIIVVDEVADRVLARGTTYGDGRVPFYVPRATAESTKLGAGGDGGDTDADAENESDGAAEAVARRLILQASFGEQTRRVRWDGVGEEFVLPLEEIEQDAEKIELDVLFLIDTTGSMQDEIEQIKNSLLSVTKRVRSLEREFDLRYGAVLYRDIGDEYVTKAHPFTGDIEAFDVALKDVRADGGGDGPESLNQGLAVAIDHAEWRKTAAKVVFLIADAAPHMDYEGDTSYSASVREAVAKGIRVHSVAASGIDPVGSLVFRQIAQYTRGKFIFIEYGGDVKKSGEAHGVKGAKKANNLDDIIYEQIKEEVGTWGREVAAK
ncbi:MAG: VWA domain-containing protein, partial [Planctomycetota bacterium]